MKIIIKELRFDTIIGLLETERKNRQQVIINCEIEYEYENSYLDYAEVRDIIKKILLEKEYEVLEDAIIYISDFLKNRFPNINTIYLQILKPDILDDCIVGVEISKEY